MSVTLGVVSVKGGVGKTTIAASLATNLVNQYGKKVLLVDANYSAPNLGAHMDILEPEKSIQEALAGKARTESVLHSRYGVDVLPGSFSFQGNFNPLKLKDRLAKLKQAYDFVIVDSAPNVNEELLSAVSASDALLLVSTGDYPTLRCSLKAAQLAQQRGKPVAGIILNKIRDPAFELSLKEIEAATGIPVVAKIPDESFHTRALFTGIPGTLYARQSKFSREISALNAALLGVKEKPSLWRRLLPFNYPKEQVNRQVLKESFYSSIFKE